MVLPALRVIAAAIFAATVFVSDAATGADRVWRLGFLDMGPAPSAALGSPNTTLEPFLQGMRELGYVEGRDFTVEVRYGNADLARLPELADQLIASGVEIIVTAGTPPALAAKQATSSIPIVMAGSEMPVERGLVASFAHPGGNVTGVTHKTGPEFSQKAFQLLEEAVPNAQRFCVLATTDEPDVIGKRAQPAPNITVYNVAGVDNSEAMKRIMQKIAADDCKALYIYPEFRIAKHWKPVVEMIQMRRLATMVQIKEMFEVAGLLYYYTDFTELRRRAATYVDKIIKGAKPADLPVEQPSKFEFIVNLRTARTFGIEVPPSVVAFADRLIE